MELPRRTVGIIFLSTPSVRRATVHFSHNKTPFLTISIHALREEGDLQHFNRFHNDFGFLSTPSVRRATRQSERHDGKPTFLSTPSVRRAT